jgi:hypothetical protein
MSIITEDGRWTLPEEEEDVNYNFLAKIVF